MFILMTSKNAKQNLIPFSDKKGLNAIVGYKSSHWTDEPPAYHSGIWQNGDNDSSIKPNL